jgi:hypothetical protein
MIRFWAHVRAVIANRVTIVQQLTNVMYAIALTVGAMLRHAVSHRWLIQAAPIVERGQIR